MRHFNSWTLIVIVVVQTVILQPAFAQERHTANVPGRWRVKLTLSGTGEKNLIVDARPGGSASFVVVEAGPNDKPSGHPVPATWALTTNDRVNFSGEINLQLSPCCVDTGTLIFKGKFKSVNSITGKAIFITTTENEENFNGYNSTVGTFTASRITDDK